MTHSEEISYFKNRFGYLKNYPDEMLTERERMDKEASAALEVEEGENSGRKFDY